MMDITVLELARNAPQIACLAPLSDRNEIAVIVQTVVRASDAWGLSNA